MANPAIPCSDNGVLKTLSTPYFYNNPLVHLNTPPNLTSSPKTFALLLQINLRWISLQTDVNGGVNCGK